MNTESHRISDDELLAFSLGDPTLGDARIAQIRAAVARDPKLAERLATVSTSLAAAFETPEPDAGFESRLFDRLRWQLPRDVAPTAPVVDVARRERSAWRAGFAMAAGLAVAIGLGYGLGRIEGDRGAPAPIASAPKAATPAIASGSPLLADDAAQRVLTAHLVDHLEETERALLVAANSPEQAATAQALASELVESNRLYAAAATHAGRPQLAQFLRQLEPILIELANRDAGSTDDLADEIREQDLTFKTRAAAALAKRELRPDEFTL